MLTDVKEQFMKKSATILSICLFCFAAFSQQVPQGINYQAVARDGIGNLIADKHIAVKVSILEKPGDQERTVYSEIHPY